MLFFDKPKQILYLKRNSIELYKGSDKTVDVTYPAGAIRLLEVVDPNALEKFLLGILPRDGDRKITLVLSSDMVFQKVFPRDQVSDDALIEGFLEKIPFAINQLEVKKISNEKQLAIIAITKNLYLPVKKILEKIGFSVEAVVPASIFGDVNSETSLNQKDIWPKVKDDKVIEAGDFLRG